MLKIILIIFVTLCDIAFSQDVVLVTTSGCPPCETMKKRLESLGIPFKTATCAEMLEDSAPVLLVFETVDGKPKVVARLRGLQDFEAIKLALKARKPPE